MSVLAFWFILNTTNTLSSWNCSVGVGIQVTPRLLMWCLGHSYSSDRIADSYFGAWGNISHNIEGEKMVDFWVKSMYFLAGKWKENVYGASVHSEGDEQREGPGVKAFVPAGRGGGAAGPAAGGGDPAAGGSGAGAPGPRAGAAYRPKRGRAHQRRGAGRPGGAAQVPRGGRGRGGMGHAGGRGARVGGAMPPAVGRCCALLTCCLASPLDGKGSRGKSRCLGLGIFATVSYFCLLLHLSQWNCWFHQAVLEMKLLFQFIST